MFAQSTAPGAGFNVRFRRITARGTAGSTVTPDIDNHSIRGIAPPSGSVLDLAAFTVQPTLDGSDLGLGYVFAAAQGSGLVYPIPGGIEIPGGTGLAMCQVGAVASAAFENAVSFLEDWL